MPAKRKAAAKERLERMRLLQKQHQLEAQAKA
jgi:hypothetical protein